MRKALLSLVVIVLTFVGASNALAQRGTYAVPAEAELNKYPILKSGEMTPAMQAKLGLHAVELTDTVTVFNYFAGTNRFVLETLVRGTYAWADKDEVLRYKADCTNRIVKASECPKCLEQIADMEVALNELNREKVQLINRLEGREKDKMFAPSEKSSVSKFLSSFWDMIGSILKWIAAAVLVLLGLGIVGLVLWGIFMALRHLWRDLTNTHPVAPAPPAPTPVVPAPVAPAPTPVPAVPTPVVTPPTPIVPVPVPTPAPTPAIIVPVPMPVPREIHLFYEDGTEIVLESRRRR